ncbi:MAG: DUF4159 domain-containing protein [Phycisphaerae bacterium]|nr:DUF4159 domain-containing protein [Phycisphaerae bacterium]
MMQPKRRIIHRDHDRDLGRAAEEIQGGVERIQALSRRKFLAGGATALGGLLMSPLWRTLGGSAVAAEAEPTVETGEFIFARLEFAVLDHSPDKWNVGPIGDTILRRKLKELTNINVMDEPKVVRLREIEEMYRHPFVFMTSEGYFELSEQEEKNLREYLDRGGFILADDCVLFGREDRFFQTYMKLLTKLYPDNPPREVPLDHEIFHIYFDFERKGSPHMQGVEYKDSNAAALFDPDTGRIMTYATPGDLHCGWMCRYWGMDKNLEAIKMGINVVIYALSH